MLITQCPLQTNKNRLIFYSIVVDESRREVYEQRDPPNPTLKRESAELYSCEPIPPLMFSTVSAGNGLAAVGTIGSNKGKYCPLLGLTQKCCVITVV